MVLVVASLIRMLFVRWVFRFHVFDLANTGAPARPGRWGGSAFPQGRARPGKWRASAERTSRSANIAGAAQTW
jgi:hypothetical protein